MSKPGQLRRLNPEYVGRFRHGRKATTSILVETRQNEFRHLGRSAARGRRSMKNLERGLGLCRPPFESRFSGRSVASGPLGSRLGFCQTRTHDGRVIPFGEVHLLCVRLSARCRRGPRPCRFSGLRCPFRGSLPAPSCGVFCPTSCRCAAGGGYLPDLLTRAIWTAGRRLLGEPHRLVEEDPLLVGSSQDTVEDVHSKR